MTSVESYTTIQQCQVREARNIGNEVTAQASFRRAAEQRIHAFLEEHHLPAEEASSIHFTIGSADGDELGIQASGEIPESLLEQLGNQLLSLAIRRGICEVRYFPPSPPDEDEYEELDEEPAQPRVARHIELRLGEATLENQTPPSLPPEDEASYVPAGATKEPRKTPAVMTFPEEDSNNVLQVSLPDGRMLTIYIAPGVEILGQDQEGSPSMTFE